MEETSKPIVIDSSLMDLWIDNNSCRVHYDSIRVNDNEYQRGTLVLHSPITEMVCNSNRGWYFAFVDEEGELLICSAGSPNDRKIVLEVSVELQEKARDTTNGTTPIEMVGDHILFDNGNLYQLSDSGEIELRHTGVPIIKANKPGRAL
jgi:hypothetical protein